MVGGGETALRRRQNRAAARVVFGRDQRQPAAGVGTHALGHRRAGERSPAEGVVSLGSHAADGRCARAASVWANSGWSIRANGAHAGWAIICGGHCTSMIFSLPDCRSAARARTGKKSCVCSRFTDCFLRAANGDCTVIGFPLRRWTIYSTSTNARCRTTRSIVVSICCWRTKRSFFSPAPALERSLWRAL